MDIREMANNNDIFMIRKTGNISTIFGSNNTDKDLNALKIATALSEDFIVCTTKDLKDNQIQVSLIMSVPLELSEDQYIPFFNKMSEYARFLGGKGDKIEIENNDHGSFIKDTFVIDRSLP